MEGMKKKTVQP
jgi:hypothetical protein